MDECPDTYMVIDVPNTVATLIDFRHCVKRKNFISFFVILLFSRVVLVAGYDKCDLLQNFPGPVQVLPGGNLEVELIARYHGHQSHSYILK